MFHVRATYNDETEPIVAHLNDTLGPKKIAVFYQDDAYGKAGLAGVERALARRQLQPASLGTVERSMGGHRKGAAVDPAGRAGRDRTNQRVQSKCRVSRVVKPN